MKYVHTLRPLLTLLALAFIVSGSHWLGIVALAIALAMVAGTILEMAFSFGRYYERQKT